jgi:deazaflavin-dependent oxidoreductase (nitroreductase family)
VRGDRFYSKMSQAMGATGLRWTGKLNVHLYRMSVGRIGGRVNRAPVLLLTTTGRKSGEPRTVPVVFLAADDNYVVIGSNAGHNRTPAWSLNLKAHPEAEIEIGRRSRSVRARIAVGEERAELWRRHNEQYSGFDEYEARTGRDIAVFVLEPH